MLHFIFWEFISFSYNTTNPSLYGNKSLPLWQQIPPFMATNPSLYELYTPCRTRRVGDLKGLKGKSKKAAALPGHPYGVPPLRGSPSPNNAQP